MAKMLLAALAVMVAAPMVLAQTAVAERAVYDLWIYQPAGDQSESYAVRARGSGRTVAATVYRQATPRLTLDDAEARTLLRRWRAASHEPSATSVLIDARTSQFRIGAFPDDDLEEGREPRDPEKEDGDTLVLIRSASELKAQAFIDDIDALSPAMKQDMKAALQQR